MTDTPIPDDVMKVAREAEKRELLGPAVKRFALFGGDRYYASGGWRDFIHWYADAAEAAEDSKALEGRLIVAQRYDNYSIDWWHVADIETGEIVAKSETEPY